MRSVAMGELLRGTNKENGGWAGFYIYRWWTHRPSSRHFAYNHQERYEARGDCTMIGVN
jgi:hypothetical protein